MDQQDVIGSVGIDFQRDHGILFLLLSLEVRDRCHAFCMRSHCALYVDAGYLLSSAATRITGTSLRAGIHVDYSSLLDSLTDQAQTLSGLPVLRIYWYDSARDGVPDAQQGRIGELDRVKLRLGRFGMDGQQKGVDLRIGLDLVNHARRRTADVFFLVSGDDDLSEAVEEAQAHGVQIVVLAVPMKDERPHGVSRHLIRAADSVVTVNGQAIDSCVLRVEKPVPPVEVPSAIHAPRISDGSSTGTTADGKSDTTYSQPLGPTPNDLQARPRHLDPTPARSILAYSSISEHSSGFSLAGGFAADSFDDEQIRSVAARVLEAFMSTANHDDRLELLRSRPSIPPDIDRALLMDLSVALGVYDVPEPIRSRGRQCFWELADSHGE